MVVESKEKDRDSRWTIIFNTMLINITRSLLPFQLLENVKKCMPH